VDSLQGSERDVNCKHSLKLVQVTNNITRQLKHQQLISNVILIIHFGMEMKKMEKWSMEKWKNGTV
jgi:hypothetical protein